MAITIADTSFSPERLPQGLLPEPDKSLRPSARPSSSSFHRPKQSMWHRLGLRRLLGHRDDRDSSAFSSPAHSRSPSRTSIPNGSNNTNNNNTRPHDTLARKLSRCVGAGLPRATTSKRRNSEHRDRLEPLDRQPRRAVSADRRRAVSSHLSNLSSQPTAASRLSVPEVQWRGEEVQEMEKEEKKEQEKENNSNDPPTMSASRTAATTTPPPPPGPLSTAGTAEGTMVEEPHEANHNQNQHHIQEDDGSDLRSEWSRPPDPDPDPDVEAIDPLEERRILDLELERRWILNLTMHFRDRSAREKLFITYAESPNLWRRVTISCDYRNAESDSLERDLSELWNQKDRCTRIYESLRESLPQIQFYDTVTNLKLETRDGRLHVHVTEDVNEVIPYPPAFHIGHLPAVRLVPESQLHFVKHESGFVYHVRLDGRSYIKKEIPGPDMVDEFLYEINALHELLGSPNVIQLEGVVVDEQHGIIKGLLITYAEQGALVDILYDYGGRGKLPWSRRERWARQIVQGLGEIHEAGYVQGDFTLSNIVLDADDNAKIIDINRRGCPVGWEPPEIVAKLESKQRISMYIGVKTDLFQLGMTLWALATEVDEPERQCRPLILGDDVNVPDYYRELVSRCLSPVPQHRLSAMDLMTFFPCFPEQRMLPLPLPSRMYSPAPSTIEPPSFMNSRAVSLEHLDLSARQSLDSYTLNRLESAPYGYITSNDVDQPRSPEMIERSKVEPGYRHSPVQGHAFIEQPGESSARQPTPRTPDDEEDTACAQALTSQHHHRRRCHNNPESIPDNQSSNSSPTTQSSSAARTRTPLADVRDGIPDHHHQAYTLPDADHNPDSPPSIADCSRPQRMPSSEASSLLHSILPINPAASASETKLMSATEAEGFESRLTLKSNKA